MKRFTTTQAAKVVGCSKSTMARLAAAGKLEHEKKGSRYVILAENRSALVEKVKAILPRHGWKRRPNGSAPPKASPKASPPIESGTLLPVITWLALPEEARTLLVELGRKFSLAELQLLRSL